MVGEDLSDKVTFEKGPVEAKAMWISGRRTFQAEGRARTKT